MSAGMRDDASTFDADILVVGAGPVGQTLCIDLAKRGVSVLLIERNETCLQHPKMERCNARTMEFYRRLGLADQIRAWVGGPDSRRESFSRHPDGRRHRNTLMRQKATSAFICIGHCHAGGRSPLQRWHAAA